MYGCLILPSFALWLIEVFCRTQKEKIKWKRELRWKEMKWKCVTELSPRQPWRRWNSQLKRGENLHLSKPKAEHIWPRFFAICKFNSPIFAKYFDAKVKVGQQGKRERRQFWHIYFKCSLQLGASHSKSWLFLFTLFSYWEVANFETLTIFFYQKLFIFYF